MVAAQAEGRARDAAERRRLTYVAVTRAADELILVGSANPPRAASAWGTIAAGVDDGSLLALCEAVRAKDLLELAPKLPRAAPTPRAEAPSAPVRPVTSPARAVAVATTPLAVFAGCARRFRLRHLVGLEEPIARGALRDDDFDPAAAGDVDVGDGADDPRALGRAAHRVLERWPAARFGAPTDPREVSRALVRASLGLEGESDAAQAVARAIARFLSSPYAARLVAEGATLGREVAFAVDVPGRADAPALVLKGAIDLLVTWPSGAVDVVDYKLASPTRDATGRVDLARHAFQLRAYALVAARGGAADVAAAVVHLAGDGDPVFLRPGDVAAAARAPISPALARAFAAELGALAARLAAARYEDRFEPVPAARCAELGCGFVTACHGDARSADPSPQLGLFG
jgi:ATP-dependent helicase/nuclease subunit A